MNKSFLRSILVFGLVVSATVVAETASLTTCSSTRRPRASCGAVLAKVRGGGAQRSSQPTGGGGGPLVQFAHTIAGAKKHLVSAAFARCVSIFSMYPVDSIKTRIQMGQANPLRWNGIFGGVGGSLLGQVPYGALTFGSYEVYKQALIDRFPEVKPFLLYSIAAVMGDLTGSVLICPSEVVKQKVQAGLFASTGKAVTSIWKQSGPIGFYEGYLGGIARDVPFRVAQLTTYEVAKDLFLKFKRRRTSPKGQAAQELTALESAMVGAVAGTIAATVTAPLDRFKTLLMTGSEQYGGSLVSCAAKVWSDEGLRGLTRGVLPRLAYITPSVAIFFVAYEAAQQRLKSWE